jgi:hypothetical protein
LHYLDTLAQKMSGCAPLNPTYRLSVIFCEGPDGKLRKIFEDASRLPRRQQEKIAEFVTAFINQYKQTHAR